MTVRGGEGATFADRLRDEHRHQQGADRAEQDVECATRPKSGPSQPIAIVTMMRMTRNSVGPAPRCDNWKLPDTLASRKVWTDSNR